MKKAGSGRFLTQKEIVFLFIVVPENWVKSRESQVPDTEGNFFFIVVPENWVKSR